VERNKNFFRKIEICQKLPSFFAEKWRKKHAKYKVIRQKTAGSVQRRARKEVLNF